LTKDITCVKFNLDDAKHHLIFYGGDHMTKKQFCKMTPLEHIQRILQRKNITSANATIENITNAMENRLGTDIILPLAIEYYKQGVLFTSTEVTK
jgi:hypothetical protein